MFEPHGNYLATLPSFLIYLAVGIVLTALFLAIYSAVTPYKELKLIREGNVAAATSLAGALFGFMLPLGAVIEYSLSLLDVLIWGVIALIVQILTFLAARLLMPGLVAAIEHDGRGQAIMLAGLSIAVGLLNAACMTY